MLFFRAFRTNPDFLKRVEWVVPVSPVHPGWGEGVVCLQWGICMGGSASRGGGGFASREGLHPGWGGGGLPSVGGSAWVGGLPPGRVCIQGVGVGQVPPGLPLGEVGGGGCRGVGQTPSEIHGIVRDTVNKQQVCILLECFLVCNNTYLNEVTFSKELTGIS